MSKTSATGYIRTTQAPNLRVQGGPWDYLLCQACEARFNEWETPFASNVFHPYLEGHRGMFRYGRWLAMFATSITWRALAFYRAHPEIAHKVIKDWSITDDAEAAWRDCLLERRANPGPYQQHLIRFDWVVGATEPVPGNLNRYLLRSFDFDVMSDGDNVIVYSKLSGFMFLGLACFDRPEVWRGTRLGFSGGLMGGRDVEVPSFLADDFLYYKANVASETMARQSEKQRQRIAETAARDPERVARSGTFQAFEHDLWLSGESAFREPEDQQ